MSILSETRNSFLVEIEHRFSKMFGDSLAALSIGKSRFPNEIAQSTRLSWPWNPVQESARGAIVTTVDGIDLIDNWLGHFCILLGHDPIEIREPIQRAIHDGRFFQSGYVTKTEGQLANQMLEIADDDQIVFGSSGAQITATAIMLGLRLTNRSRVLKIHGGFHGIQPWGMVGIRTAGPDAGGLPPGIAESVDLVQLNDLEGLDNHFLNFGAETAVVISELALVNAGVQMAHPKFVRRLRELTSEYGSVLVFDEIVTGLRVHAGSLSSLYGVKPDLTTWGKAVSGGMPFSCLTGSSDLLRLINIDTTLRVWGDNGTFTAHPGALTAAMAITDFVQSGKAAKSYHAMHECFGKLRSNIESLLSTMRIDAVVTGRSHDASIPDLPMGAIHFIRDADYLSASPATKHWNGDLTDRDLRDKILKPLLMLQGVYPWQGLGAFSFAHGDDLVKRTIEIYEHALKEVLDSGVIGR